MKKEIDMSIFLEDDERYADAINVFGNMPKGTVAKEDIQPYDTKLHFDVGTFLLPGSRARQERLNLRQHRKSLITKQRDMARRIIFGVNFMIAEMELQETVDYSYPLRDMGYTYGEYEQQARKIRRLVRRENKSISIANSSESQNQSKSAVKTNESSKAGKSIAKISDSQKQICLRPGEYLYGFRKESRLRPSVIFLLYFGEKPWDGPTCIHDMLDFTDIPQKIKALVQNHHINLIDVRRMSNEMLEQFQTDLGKVLRVIKNAEKKDELKKLVENDPYYKEMEQDAYLLTANYIKANELLDYEKYEKGGKCDMCKAIKELIEDGRMEGREEGRKEGRNYLLFDLVQDEVINVTEAAKRMGVTEEIFLKTMQAEVQNR